MKRLIICNPHRLCWEDQFTEGDGGFCSTREKNEKSRHKFSRKFRSEETSRIKLYDLDSCILGQRLERGLLSK
jgi:hypothetical protein